MLLPAILANTIWSASFPYGFQFFGLHVVVELPLEAWVIWLLIHRRERFGWLFGRVLLANVASFFVGIFALGGFTAIKVSLLHTTLSWLGAFLVSVIVENFLLQRWLQSIQTRDVVRACFWGNVASYTLAALIFIAWFRGVHIPWPMIH
ncbi:MAG: hypothetical protein ABL974_11915 [Prosthecobacter sp.]